MTVQTRYLPVESRGNGDILDITGKLQAEVDSTKIKAGIVTIFTPSATSGITSLEYESGCVKDFQRFFDEILPPDRDYAHNLRWGDGNGHSHARAALLKASFTVPIVDGKIVLGTWQSVVFIDFDNRARQRELLLQVIGE